MCRLMLQHHAYGTFPDLRGVLVRRTHGSLLSSHKPSGKPGTVHATLGEDASRIRARHAPANNATLNNIALAIVFHRGFHHLPDAQMHFMMRREDALDAILSPT